MIVGGLDLYDTTIPLYVLSKILGLSPFALRGKRGDRKYVPDYNIVVVIRFIVLIGVLCYVGILVDTMNLKYNIEGLAVRVELYLGTLNTAFILIAAVANKHLMIQCVEDIAHIDWIMISNNMHVTYKNAKIFNVHQILFIGFVFTMKFIIQFFNSSKILIFTYTSFNVVDFINTIMLFQYVDLLLLLRQRYIWLNRKLKSLKFMRDKSYLGEVSTGTDIHKTLRFLAKLHDNLYVISRKINKSYSLQLLLTIAMRFMMITIQLFKLYKAFNSHLYSANDTNSSIVTVIYLILNVLKIFMIVSLSSNTADKAKDTALIVQKMLKYKRDLRPIIDQFSLQVLQQDMHFSASGFFVLDYTVIYNMIGAITTYLIILIQFDLSKTEETVCPRNATI